MSNSFILLKNNIYRLFIGFLIYYELVAAFARSELHPGDLKYFEQLEMKKLTAAAYPPPSKATKAADDVM